MDDYEEPRYHTYQRETESDKRYHLTIKDEGGYHEEEIRMERGSPTERLSPTGQGGARKRTRHWTYDQIMRLIKFWKKEEVLYNVKHPSYHDKDTKNNAINHIVAKLADEAVFVTCEEVVNKMHSLRVYFANKRNKLHDSKKSGEGHDDSFKITWPYYESLMFLNDNVISRSSSSSIVHKPTVCDPEVDHDGERFCEGEPMAPPTKISKALERNGGVCTTESANYDVDDAVTTASNTSQLTISYNSAEKKVVETQDENGRSDDDVFCEMICRQLKKIPEGASKDFFKLDLYRFVVSSTYRASGLDSGQYSQGK